MSDANMRIIIDILVNGEGNIKNLISDLGSLNASINTGGGNINIFNGSINGTGAASNNAITGLDRLMLTMGELYAAGIIVEKGLQKAFDFAEEGAQIKQMEDMTVGLANLSNSSSQKIISAIKESTLETVTDYQAASMANRALSADFGLSSQQIGDMAEVAMYKARVYGQGVDDVYNNILKAMIALSPRMLASYGIIDNSAQVWSNYANSIGVSVSELTREQKVQTEVADIINQTKDKIAITGGMVATQATDYQRFGASMADFWQGIQKGVGSLFDPAIAMTNAMKLATQLHQQGILTDEEYTETSNRLRLSSTNYGEEYNNMLKKQIEYEKQWNETTEANNALRYTYAKDLINASGATSIWNDKLAVQFALQEKLDPALEKFNDAYYKLGKQSKAVVDNFDYLNGTMEKYLPKVQRVIKDAKALNDVFSDMAVSSLQSQQGISDEKFGQAAVAIGALNPMVFALQFALDGLSSEYSKGIIGLTEYTDRYKQLREEALHAPKGWTVDNYINYWFVYHGMPYGGSWNGVITGATGQISMSSPILKASGGPVMPYETYIVGENGPEVLKMGNTSGNITPNDKLSGGTTIHITMPNMTVYGDQKSMEWTLKPAIKAVLREALPNQRII